MSTKCDQRAIIFVFGVVFVMVNMNIYERIFFINIFKMYVFN
jgi:hypothetical protein